MTKQYDNTNRGALFKVENKEADEHADYRGEVNAAGVDYWLDGWVRTSKKGTRFISFRLKPKTGEAKAKPTGSAPRFGDDVPFMPERRG